MKAEDIDVGSDNYSATSAHHLVSKGTSDTLAQFVALRTQEGAHVSATDIANLVTSHEATHPSDRITATLYLPEAATRLDQNTFQASNMSDLLIATTNLRISDTTRGGSPYKQEKSSADRRRGNGGGGAYPNRGRSGGKRYEKDGKYRSKDGSGNWRGSSGTGASRQGSRDKERSDRRGYLSSRRRQDGSQSREREFRRSGSRDRVYYRTDKSSSRYSKSPGRDQRRSRNYEGDRGRSPRNAIGRSPDRRIRDYVTGMGRPVEDVICYMQLRSIKTRTEE